MKKVRRVFIAGTGSYVPERVLTNRELERMVDTSDEWIQARTGMKERRIAAPGEATSDIAANAARRALEDADIKAEDLDLLVVATFTPDMFLPSTACFVQEKIGAKNAFCYDLSAACSGFLFALEAARNQVATGAVNTALVIGAETMSAFIDWEDRNTCILFGDGAGAAVLKAEPQGRGVMNAVLGSDGFLAHLLWIPGCGSRNPASPEVLEDKKQFVKMEGREVFKHAVTRMCEAVTKAINKNGLTVDDIGCFIPHQANIRMIEAVSRRLKIRDRIYVNVHKYANTSAAALAIALDEAVRDGTITEGDLVALTVFGGGFTWGATVLEWEV